MILKLGDQTVCPVVTVTPTDYTLQAKNAAPSTSSQTISPDTGYYGLSKVTLGAVTSAIDPNIVAGNIKQGVTILGVAGTVQEGGTIQSSKTATPSTSSQTITPDSGYDGLGQVIVNPVTASIDSNIAAGNIKSGVFILGVSGSLTPASLTTQTITPTTSAQTVTPTSPYNGFSAVTVPAVTAAIDSNITAANIKSGVTILGVQGSLVVQHYYTGTSVPSSSLGSNGDIYLQV